MTFLRVSGVALAVAIGLGPIVPPEHVHETEEHGHHRMVVHRHAEAHRLPVPGAPQREIHEDDVPILTLTPLFTVPGAPDVPPASTTTVVVLPEPPVAVAFHRAGDSGEPLIHGPPRAPAPQRGPPRSSRL